MKFDITGKTLLILVYAGVFIMVTLMSYIPMFIPMFNISEVKALGKRMELRNLLHPPEICKDIIVITIDEKSKERLGRWPWTRDKYAKLIESLAGSEDSKVVKEKGPSVIAFDIVFSEEDRKYDGDMAKAIERAGNVVLAVGHNPRLTTREKIIFQPLAEKIREIYPTVGSVSVLHSPEEKIVKMPYIIKGAYEGSEDIPQTLFTFETVIYKTHYGGIDDLTRGRKLSEMPPFIINYEGILEKTFRTYSFVDVYEGKINKEELRGKIALIVNTFDFNDRYTTTTGREVFGGEIHAHALRTLVEKDYIEIPPRWVQILIYLLLSLCAVVIKLRVRHTGKAFLAICLFIVFYAILNSLIFAFSSLLLPVTLPSMGALFFSIGYVIAERYILKRTLGALLPESFMKRLDTMRGQPEAGGKPVWATVLFADIRGYTNLSENLSSIEVMNMLNEYHGTVKNAIHGNGGEIFDFQGDAYMVVFGADEKSKDHAGKAVKAAVDICKVVDVIKKKWENEGKRSFEVGIGISTGEVALGYVGHDRKLMPAAIGDTTNVAARLQGKSSELKAPILMTETTALEIKEEIPTISLQAVELKGKKDKLQVYTVDWEKLQG